MQVIGAGFGRTGTMSLKAALEQLGFGPCYHMKEVFENPSHIRVWQDRVAGRPVNWRTLFKDYHATVDWPACTYYKELLEVYPDAKVLLSVRDPEAWYQSCIETIWAISQTFPMKWTAWMVPVIGGILRMNTRQIWEQTFGGRFLDREHAIGVYRQHIEDVRRTVPPEQLLVFDVREGWAPLCRFLEVPVPEGPFPRLNDTAEFKKNIRRAQLGSTLIPLALLGGVVGLVATGVWWRAAK